MGRPITFISLLYFLAVSKSYGSCGSSGHLLLDFVQFLAEALAISPFCFLPLFFHHACCLININDPLINAVPQNAEENVEITDDDVSSLGGASIHTARLYSDVSEEEFSDCNKESYEKVNKLWIFCVNILNPCTWRT